MVYSVGYHAGRPKPCSRSDCKAGNLVVSGQLHFEVPNGHAHHSRHFDCLSKEQKKAIRWKHKLATDLSGYASLKPGDKARVRESIGLNEEGQGTTSVQNRVDSTSEKTEGKGKGKEKAPHPDFQEPENVPGSLSQHTENRARSPEHFQWWHDNTPSWDDPESPSSPQEAVSPSKGKEASSLNKQYRWGSSQPAARAQRVPQPAGAIHQQNIPSISEQRAPQDSEDRILSASTEPTSVPDLPVANLGPPAAPKPEVDTTVLMKLELEDKEAEARLAEAELLLAETRIKVETARRAVVAQKLKMAKAGIPPSN